MYDSKRAYYNLESALDNADDTYNVIMAARASRYNRYNRETMMNDSVYRHAAFDALDSAAEKWNIAEPYHEGIRAGLRQASRIIMNLPSAQPEVIRCKDCKHYNAGFECLIEGYGIERDENWYCGDAERRTE